MFKLYSKFKPTGDQPKAIDLLTKGVLAGIKKQTLLGVTGSGKTFTMAGIIANVNRPTLIISHNKTLSAQLFSEFKDFFPENHVEYFVSYYDYYQPEAYIPRKDLYIEKDASINESIERYRSSATQSILTQKDVIIVASVSCIYGIGNPQDYESLARTIRRGEIYEREKLIIHLTDLLYERESDEFRSGTFRVRGDVIDISDVASDLAIRIEFFGDEIENIFRVNKLTGEVLESLETYTIFPAKHFVTPEAKLKSAIKKIRLDLEKEVRQFRKQGKDLEAQRLWQRTNYDLEMMEEVGYTTGIENYSRYLEGRLPGTPPSSLLDYFPKDWLLFIDESHITVPQIRGMYNGDRARKETLVKYGFRMQSALDNRPLKYEEFENKISQVIYVSATPSEYELSESKKSVKVCKKLNPHVFRG